MNKLHSDRVIIVEGKYDKIKLSAFVDAEIITTDGFAVFKNKEKNEFIRALCKKVGAIILTDSDSAGMLIRNHIKNILGADYDSGKIINLYTPQIKGKEKRKNEPSKEGFLGVEGIDTQTLISVLEPYLSYDAKICAGLQKIDFYEMGLSGKDGSEILRKKLCKRLGLPEVMSANAMLDAVNVLFSREEFEAAAKEVM